MLQEQHLPREGLIRSQIDNMPRVLMSGVETGIQAQNDAWLARISFSVIVSFLRLPDHTRTI